MYYTTVQQRRVQTKGNDQCHYEILVSDENQETAVSFADFVKDVRQKNEFFESEFDLLKTIFESYENDLLTGTFSDIIYDTILHKNQIEIDEVFYNYEEYKQFLKDED